MLVSSLQSPLLLRLPSFPFLPRPPSFLPDSAFFYPQTHIRRPPFFRLRRRPPAVLPATDQELLQGLAGSADGAGDEARAHLPAVRSYEGDLARLTLVGAVSYDQALTAAAADGGDAADEHLSSGTSTMVVETVFPGGSDEHSTVSTKLDTADITVSSSDERFHSALAEAICSYTLEDTERNYLGNVDSQDAHQMLGVLIYEALATAESGECQLEQLYCHTKVVLSGDGKMIGFQPTSRVAVNHWASNPLEKVLCGGRKLSPGLLEPTLRIPYRHEVVLMELLMSVNLESSFALLRPTEQSCYAL